MRIIAKVSRCLISLLIMLIAVPAIALADQHDRAKVLAGTHTEKQFIAGGEVRVSADVNNDIFAAGGDVNFGGGSAVDIFAAGGDVSFDEVAAEMIIAAGGQLRYSGTRVGDLITAGGDVEIGAGVAEDLIAAGGSVHLRSAGRVGGDALMAGGELVIDGTVVGNLRARGGEIRIGGDILGNVDLAGRDITIEPGARIAGNLVYASKRPADIAAGSVGGDIVREEALGFPYTLEAPPLLGAWTRLGVFVGLALAALVLYGATPAAMDGAVDTLVAKPGLSFGIGLLVFVGVPVLAILLTITLIGLPLAVLLGALYFAGFVPAYVTMGTWAGGRLAHFARQTPVVWGARFFWVLAGLAALILASAIPFVGGIVAAATLLFGLGALTMQIAQADRTR